MDASEFGEILNGMLNGNAAMGIKRVRDAEARQALDEVSSWGSAVPNVGGRGAGCCLALPLTPNTELLTEIHQLWFREQRSFKPLEPLFLCG